MGIYALDHDRTARAHDGAGTDIRQTGACPLHIPLLGIDWLGSLLWSGFMLCFTFVCVYGDYFDWLDAVEIRGATVLCLLFLAVNLWRASFLHHPYISYAALTNRNVVRATLVYLVFFTLVVTEHVFEHSYASAILGFDETNLIDLNWYVFAGILAGCAFTYLTFALRKWGYCTMTAIAFALAAVYLAWFYFYIDYGVEKESLLLPLFARGAASVIISIVFLTSIVQSDLPFMVFPQALTLNGFAGAVMGATVGPAVIGELLQHIMARNSALLESAVTSTCRLTSFSAQLDSQAFPQCIGQLQGMVQLQSLVESMKEIYGLLLMIALVSLLLILVSYSHIRPFAIFPKWKTIRRAIRHSLHTSPE